MNEGLNAQDIARQLGLKKAGREWSGPCPLCGGHDRFHLIDRGGTPRFGCRGCIDGQPPAVRRSKYREVLQVLGAPLHRNREKEMAAMQQDRENAQAAAHKAQRMMWAASWEQHPYLANKGFPEAEGRVWKDMLLVPAYSPDNVLVSTQMIQPDGSKRFLWGSRVGNARHQYGKRGPAIVCEGYATALSIHAAMKTVLNMSVRVRAAFSAANIPNVVSDESDIIVADHDRPDQLGRKAGEHYARQAKVTWWQPPTPGQDANDYHQRYGLLSLAIALEPLLPR